MVGAAGVLVLPRRSQAPENKERKKGEVVDLSDVHLLVGNSELLGWEAEKEELSAWKLFDASSVDRSLSEYVAAEVGPRPEPSPSGVPPASAAAAEEVKAVTANHAPSKPCQGPSLFDLARDSRRREECPVCAAEWKEAVQGLQEGRLPVDKGGGMEIAMRGRGPVARRGNKAPMHSLNCNWAWFQQNLCALLCSLRFDPRGDPRPSPPSPSTVLPPPMPDVLQHWRQKGPRTSIVDRSGRGEPGP